MPPKFKFTKEKIVESALKIVRRKGWGALSMRSLAGELGSSSRPIYSFFSSIMELEEEIVKKAVELLYKYGDLIWNTLTSSLSDYPAFQGLSEEQIYKIQVTRWLLARRLAFQASNPPLGTWDIKTISSVMQEGSLAILDGIRYRIHSSEQ